MNLKIANLPNTDADDPVVWQVGKMLPDGRVKVFYMTRSCEQRLLDAFGAEWLAQHLREQEEAVQKFGVS